MRLHPPVARSEVCTLGRNIGAILFMDGRRVRNSPLNELYTSILAPHWLQLSAEIVDDLMQKLQIGMDET